MAEGALPDGPNGDPPHALADVLDRLGTLDRQDGADVSVAHILSAVGPRAYGPLLLIVGLVSISPLTAAPGATWLSAAVALLLSVQMMTGARHPWLPRSALDLSVPNGRLQRAASRLRPCARRIDRVSGPRLTWLVDPPFAIITAAACAAAALLTFPLGLIPLAPIAPGLAISFFGLALTTRDGLMAGLGWISIGAIAYFAYRALS